MKQYAFKVVKNAVGGLLSVTNRDHSYGLEYEEGKWTYPKIGKLFCFDDLHLAINFINEAIFIDYEIWLVEVINPVETSVRGNLTTTGITMFWDKKSLSKVYSVPPGTIFVDAVKLIKRIQ